MAPDASKKNAHNPEKRLARFKREYSHLLVSSRLHVYSRIAADRESSKYGEGHQICLETLKLPRTFEAVSKN